MMLFIFGKRHNLHILQVLCCMIGGDSKILEFSNQCEGFFFLSCSVTTWPEGMNLSSMRSIYQGSNSNCVANFDPAMEHQH